MDSSQSYKAEDVVEGDVKGKACDQDEEGNGNAVHCFLADALACARLDGWKDNVSSIKGWYGKQVQYAKVKADHS